MRYTPHPARDEYNISVATLPLFIRLLNALRDSFNDSRNYWHARGRDRRLDFPIENYRII